MNMIFIDSNFVMSIFSIQSISKPFILGCHKNDKIELKSLVPKMFLIIYSLYPILLSFEQIFI